MLLLRLKVVGLVEVKEQYSMPKPLNAFSAKPTQKLFIKRQLKISIKTPARLFKDTGKII